MFMDRRLFDRLKHEARKDIVVEFVQNIFDRFWQMRELVYRIVVGIAFLVCLLVACFFFLTMYGCKSAPDYKRTDTYLKQSNIDPRKTVIYGADGKEKGYLKQSNIDPRKTVEYDKHGKEKGFWRRDYLDSRKTRFYKKK
jgi:hypothetical protein